MQSDESIAFRQEQAARPSGRTVQAFIPVPRRGRWTAEDVTSFQFQETSIILLNLLILAGLLLTQIAFERYLGSPSVTVIVAFAVRFALQVLELIILQCLERPMPTAFARAYSVVSIWVHVAFAFLVSVLATGEDTHYAVLMIVPIISAAFRFSLAGSLGVVAAAGGLTILEVWLYFHQGDGEGSLAEYFEASTMILVYLVVALVVWLLTRHLRDEKARLAETLVELESTRDRLVAEERLAAVGRLSSAVAHEIRNPVAMIASSLTLARQAGTSPSLREEMFDIASKEAARLEAMTGDFLVYAHSKAPVKRPTSCRAMLDYVAGLAKAQAAEAEVDITVDGSVGGDVEVDEFQIHRALLNLARNAIEASSPGGRIIMGWRPRHDGGADLYVENCGHPIPEELTSRMFEPFVSGKSNGAGLGLSIARSIARAHEGDLVLEENSDDRVRLTIALPKLESRE